MERSEPLVLTPTTIYMSQKLLNISHVKRYSLYIEIVSTSALKLTVQFADANSCLYYFQFRKRSLKQVCHQPLSRKHFLFKTASWSLPSIQGRCLEDQNSKPSPLNRKLVLGFPNSNLNLFLQNTYFPTLPFPWVLFLFICQEKRKVLILAWRGSPSRAQKLSRCLQFCNRSPADISGPHFLFIFLGLCATTMLVSQSVHF